jgi:hypothetical protein
MKHVKRGHGIKFLDEDLEVASFKTLIAVYSHLVSIDDPGDLNKILFLFQEYIYKEYCILKNVCNHYERCNCLEGHLKILRVSIEQKLFMTPSEILGEIDNIRRLKKEIKVTSCFPWRKLK